MSKTKLAEFVNHVAVVAADLTGLDYNVVAPAKKISIEWNRGDQYEYDTANVTLIFDSQEDADRIDKAAYTTSDCKCRAGADGKAEWVWINEGLELGD